MLILVFLQVLQKISSNNIMIPWWWNIDKHIIRYDAVDGKNPAPLTMPEMLFL